MTIRDLMPWSRDTSQSPSLLRDADRDPFMGLHREMSRLVDDMFRGFESRLPSMGRFSSAGTGWPSVEISETDKEIRVTAEIPGMEEKDIEVLLDDGVLTLRGEKHSETDDKERQFSERFYGRFERRIPIGFEVAEDKVAADFRNGVLSVSLPKSEKAQSKAKRIPIGGKSTKH
ncbi:heat-shock protein Hsp20 [Mesorhizobium huakuii]|uniref:Hsp20/alpha crystallin family protein n=1 Tax=Mesorhizobium huakuii TaxID=28104 RepID=A0ABZ0VWN8_9HYPH|nr:Hsp20/alpha crystallin family protein [Mesorhizobium huakuii]WQC00660.1 Hsp20/alpha crystallin family protein [Mesorhizobium huakuii]GLQ78039.1 heat-shock protein Hsp20 [Mesorhizobium huakuii]